MSDLAPKGGASDFSWKNLSLDRKLAMPRGFMPRDLGVDKKFAPNGVASRPRFPINNPHPKGTGRVGSDRRGLYTGSNAHEPEADAAIETALKGWASRPRFPIKNPTSRRNKSHFFCKSSRKSRPP
jgi:hypothetical protein